MWARIRNFFKRVVGYLVLALLIPVIFILSAGEVWCTVRQRLARFLDRLTAAETFSLALGWLALALLLRALPASLVYPRWLLISWVILVFLGPSVLVYAHRKRYLLSVAILLAAPVALWAVVLIPPYQVRGLPPDQQFEHEDNARGTVAQVVVGIFGLGALIAAWRRIEVAQEGQITERFTRAIEQLGATEEHSVTRADGVTETHTKPRLEIRLGGIYALERLARDSEKDHWTIMEILTAYVRENVPWKEPQTPRSVTA